MFTMIIGFLGSVIPGLTTLASNWTKAYYDAKVRLVTARVGGDVADGYQIGTGRRGRGSRDNYPAGYHYRQQDYAAYTTVFCLSNHNLV